MPPIWQTFAVCPDRFLELESMELTIALLSILNAVLAVHTTFPVSLLAVKKTVLRGEQVPIEEYYADIVQLFAGTALGSIAPNFTIREPKFVPFFLDVDQTSDRFEAP
jgi:hypothetical protein